MSELADLRPFGEKVEEFAQRETEALIVRCTPEQQAFARKIIDAQQVARGGVDWRTVHELARRTLMKQDTSQEVSR